MAEGNQPDPPSLAKLALAQCVRFSNLIADVGELRFELVEPILAKLGPNQLLEIETLRPLIAEESDHLWRDIIIREFPSRPLPYNDFRHYYFQLLQEKEAQLGAARERLIKKQQQYETAKRESSVVTLTRLPPQGFTDYRRGDGSFYLPHSKRFAAARRVGAGYRSKSMQLVAKQMQTHSIMRRIQPSFHQPKTPYEFPSPVAKNASDKFTAGLESYTHGSPGRSQSPPSSTIALQNRDQDSDEAGSSDRELNAKYKDVHDPRSAAEKSDAETLQRPKKVPNSIFIRRRKGRT